MSEEKIVNKYYTEKCPQQGTQPDWNQNDETAADYVKNRPGGYTKTTPGYEIT